jgi:hypothetical protein
MAAVQLATSKFAPRAAWQPPPLTVGEVKDLIARLLAAPMSQPAKATTKLKLMQALYGGGQFRILSLDIEALPLGDSDCNPDSIILVLGVQPIIIEGWQIRFGKPQQKMVADGFDSVDLANWAHEESAGFDALLMYYAKYDHDICSRTSRSSLNVTAGSHLCPPSASTSWGPLAGRASPPHRHTFQHTMESAWRSGQSISGSGGM